MGFFSWKTSDTQQSISNIHSEKNTFSVKMIDNKGNEWHEDKYDGYGVFGNKDFFELLAEMNGLQSDRLLGIDLAFSKKDDIIYPKLITKECTLKWGNLNNSENCPDQGFFYE